VQFTRAAVLALCASVRSPQASTPIAVRTRTPRRPKRASMRPAPARPGRQEGEARAQRFSLVHVAFARKEAALRERAEAAEAAAERQRQVSCPKGKPGGFRRKVLCVQQRQPWRRLLQQSYLQLTLCHESVRRPWLCRGNTIRHFSSCPSAGHHRGWHFQSTMGVWS